MNKGVGGGIQPYPCDGRRERGDATAADTAAQSKVAATGIARNRKEVLAADNHQIHSQKLKHQREGTLLDAAKAGDALALESLNRVPAITLAGLLRRSPMVSAVHRAFLIGGGCFKAGTFL